VKRAEARLQKLRPPAGRRQGTSSLLTPFPAVSQRMPPPVPAVPSVTPPPPVTELVPLMPVTPVAYGNDAPDPADSGIEEDRAALSVADCMQARAESGHPAEYCMGLGSGCINVWGCRLLGMDWAAGAEWLRIGAFRDDDTFVFDRQTIRRLLHEVLPLVQECPHVRRDYIDLVLQALPGRASVWGHWKYREGTRHDDGAVQVTVRTYLHGLQMTTRKTVLGLDPVGIRDALKVIRRASRNVQELPIDLALLAKA